MIKKNYLAIFAKSFNWAGFFLPKKIYEDCAKLYAFCRVLDNVADEENNLDSKIERFNKIKSFYKNTYALSNKEIRSLDKNEMIINDMVALAEKNKIKRIILDDLIDGVSSDLKKKIHVNSVKDLLIYSYKVAGTVGLMMSKILNVNDRRALKGAIDLGIAMQLTNISRDVIEDLRINRSYINENFEEIKSTLMLAEKFYENSFQSIKEIPISFRFSILVARRVYRKIGYKILKQKNLENYRKSGKIYVSNLEKIIETFLSVFDLIKLLLINKNDDYIQHDHLLISEELNLDERI